MNIKIKVAIALFAPGAISLILAPAIGQVAAWLGVGFMVGAIAMLILARKDPHTENAGGGKIGEDFFLG